MKVGGAIACEERVTRDTCRAAISGAVVGVVEVPSTAYETDSAAPAEDDLACVDAVLNGHACGTMVSTVAVGCVSAACSSLLSLMERASSA